MSRRLIIIGLVALLCSVAVAQEEEEVQWPRGLDLLVFSEDELPPCCDPYPENALEFGVGGDFNLFALDGMDIALMKRTSATRGWRLGLSLEGESDEYEEVAGDSGVTRVNERRPLDMDVVLQRIHYLPARRGVSLYWGVGPSVGMQRERSSQSVDDSSMTYTMRLWSAGVEGQLGVEWRFMDQFALGARYQWKALYWWREGEETGTIDQEEELLNSYSSNGYDFNRFNGVDLVLTVYY